MTVRSSWIRRIRIPVLALLLAACGPETVTTEPCIGAPIAQLRNSTITVPEGRAAACIVEFRTVVTLAGDLDGVAPRPPIVRGPHGTYLTGTYGEGQIAVWDADGSLQRTIGNGPGDGPGEFGSANGITVLSDSLLLVTTGRPRWHTYTIDGEFVESGYPRTTSGVGRLALTESGELVGAASQDTYGILFTWKNGETRQIPLPDARRTIPVWTYHDSGSWYAWHYEYRIMNLDRKTEIVRVNAWLSPEDPRLGNLFEISIDEEDRVWVFASVADPDAPGEPPLAASSSAELEQQARLYRDIIMEAISVDGRLIVSERFDHYHLLPKPMQGGGWYHESEDPLPVITIVQPVLRPKS